MLEILYRIYRVRTQEEREKYWIQEYYKSCPEKSLNISQVSSKAFKEAIETEKRTKSLLNEEENGR